MNCLMDNDVVLKLAAIRLLEDWLARAIGADEEVRVLDTARFYFKNKKDLPKRYGQAGVSAAIAFAQAQPTVGRLDNPEQYAALSAVPGIDPGEAILLSAACHRVEFLVVSGDKLSLKSLQKETSCANVRAQLKGRIIAFEQVVLALIHKGSFRAIREKVVGMETTDIVLQVAFGLGLETTQEKAIAALEYYLAQLRQETGDLLIAQAELEQCLIQ